MLDYGEYEHTFRRKSNTAAAAKERETAWENIAARVNACNSTGEKRTWKQLKMKHINIIQNALWGGVVHQPQGGAVEGARESCASSVLDPGGPDPDTRVIDGARAGPAAPLVVQPLRAQLLTHRGLLRRQGRSAGGVDNSDTSEKEGRGPKNGWRATSTTSDKRVALWLKASPGEAHLSLSTPMTQVPTSDAIVDGVICLVQPPTETTVNPAAVSIPYSDLASDGSSKYSETESFPASQEEEDDEETLSAATGRDPEGLLKCVLILCIATGSALPIHIHLHS
ncbi:hypothetical protein N1851_024973 [Merluccius polli]|uniref:Myb/SANT-like DNA-binding domain-containing protein n=1 Tax=Merluccius polli TaxID=89951 RepID=A0AA47ME10_MERPO|nr:hypothetical protein N1851_024973 [Merluccius polli]